MAYTAVGEGESRVSALLFLGAKSAAVRPVSRTPGGSIAHTLHKTPTDFAYAAADFALDLPFFTLSPSETLKTLALCINANATASLRPVSRTPGGSIAHTLHKTPTDFAYAAGFANRSPRETGRTAADFALDLPFFTLSPSETLKTLALCINWWVHRAYAS
jgi:hypothetical protein